MKWLLDKGLLWIAIVLLWGRVEVVSHNLDLLAVNFHRLLMALLQAPGGVGPL